MILAAESLGIGTCWIGLVTFLFKSDKAEEFLKLLQIPEGYEPYYAITLGYKKIENHNPAEEEKILLLIYIKCLYKILQSIKYSHRKE